MELTTIKIDEVEYVRKDSISEPDIVSAIKIVVLQRGWVSVGYFTRSGNDCQLNKSSSIRYWGTTQGLGQIAKDGPTEKTRLDKENGLVEFDYLTVIKTICCEESKWENAL